jgi:spermidine/putrescine transport system substrate-binding protein
MPPKSLRFNPRTSQLRGTRSPLIYLNRRRFLQFSAATLSSIALSNCRQPQADPDAQTSEATTSPQAGSSEPLRIYTWPDYSSDEVYKRFTDQTGIPVIADTYDSNETMLAKIQAGGGNAYSVLYPSDYMVTQMIELDLLSELDQARIVGLGNLLDQWQNPPYDPNNTYSVPFSWGTTGFIYNTTVLNPGPTDWDYLWQEQEQLAGKMTLLEDVREMMGAVLKSLGYSYNSTNPNEIEQAYQRLLELKPAIAAFQSFGWEEQLLAGDLVLCMTYSTLGNALATEHPEFDYVIPSSGSSVWTDTMVVPKTAPNPDAAYAWINFIMAPENATFAVEQLKFATPNQVAIDNLPQELTSNTDFLPTAEMLAKCEGIAPIGEAIDIYDRYWTQLQSN